MSPAHAAGDRRRRGRPVLRAQRRRPQGRRPRVRRQPAGRRRVPGRLDDHHAVRADVAARLARDARRGRTRPPSGPAPASSREMRLAHRAGEASSTRRDPGALPERRRTSATARTASTPPPRCTSPSSRPTSPSPRPPLLAGLVQAPSAYDPASTDPTAAHRRRDYVIDRMVDAGYCRPDAGRGRQGRADRAEAAPSRPTTASTCRPRTTTGASSATCSRPGGCEQPAVRRQPAERLDRLRRGGYTIVTTLDPTTRTARQPGGAARSASARRTRWAWSRSSPAPAGSRRWRSTGCTRSTSPATGRTPTRASRASRLRGNYPATVNPLLGGGDLPGYQAGSTFKMFTLLAALERGMPLSTQINSPQRYRSKFTTEPGSPRPCGRPGGAR